MVRYDTMTKSHNLISMDFRDRYLNDNRRTVCPWNSCIAKIQSCSRFALRTAKVMLCYIMLVIITCHCSQSCSVTYKMSTKLHDFNPKYTIDNIKVDVRIE